MADSLKHFVGKLAETKIISLHPPFVKILKSINRFADNDSHKAYLLGYFFKTKVVLDNLPVEIKNSLSDTIKGKNLDTYFYLKTIPKSDNFWNLFYFAFILVIGVILTVVGIIQLKNDVFGYGYKIILGLFLFVGGLIRLRHEIRKRHFLESFLAAPKNSN